MKIKWRLSDEEITYDTNEEHKNMIYRRNTKTKIFLGYTSNLISAGVREQIRYLVQNKMVDVLVTSAGIYEYRLCNNVYFKK